jgi:membrane protein
VTESPVAEPGGRLSRLARSPLDVMRGTGRALPRAIEDLYADRCPQYAAAIAYRVLFSLFPLTIFLIAIFGLVLQDATIKHNVENELLDVLPLSPKGREDLQNSIEGIASPLSAIGLFSLVALLWGASGMMAAIRVGLDVACKVERGRPAVHAKAIDLLLVAATGLAVLIVVGLSAFAAFFGRLVDRAAENVGINASPSGVLLRDVLQLLVFGVMALLLYRFVPTTRPRTRPALAGAVVAALLAWAATKILQDLFNDPSRYNKIYLSLVGVMVFLFFVYVVALILLFGAEFAYAWSQPEGPPGPPLRRQLLAFLRGLFVAPREEEESEPAPEQSPPRT